MLKLCRSLSCRQCHVSSREPVGRRPHSGGSSRSGSEPRNCCWCFTYRCSRWRLGYNVTVNQMFRYAPNDYCCHEQARISKIHRMNMISQISNVCLNALQNLNRYGKSSSVCSVCEDSVRNLDSFYHLVRISSH